MAVVFTDTLQVYNGWKYTFEVTVNQRIKNIISRTAALTAIHKRNKSFLPAKVFGVYHCNVT